MLLLDHSAWARLKSPKLPEERVAELAEAAATRRLAVCLPFLLEAGYSARSAEDHEAVLAELMALPLLRVDDAVETRALDAQRQLARAGHHRLPPSDVLIAAIADRNGLGVLHYDAHYDVIASKTDLDFASEWLAQPGSL